MTDLFPSIENLRLLADDGHLQVGLGRRGVEIRLVDHHPTDVVEHVGPVLVRAGRAHRGRRICRLCGDLGGFGRGRGNSLGTPLKAGTAAGTPRRPLPARWSRSCRAATASAAPPRRGPAIEPVSPAAVPTSAGSVPETPRLPRPRVRRPKGSPTTDQEGTMRVARPLDCRTLIDRGHHA